MKIETFILFFTIALGFLGFSIPVQADTIFTDNFNTYVPGGLVGQGDWIPLPNYSQTASYTVQPSVVNEGTSALALTGTSADGSLIYKTGTSTADGTATIYFRVSDTSNARAYIGLAQGATINFFLNIDQTQAGKVLFYRNNSGFTDVPGDVSANTWHFLQIQWRSSDHTARYRLDDNSFTDYFPGFNSWISGGLNSIVLGGINLPGATSYFDTFQENEIPRRNPVLIVPGLTGTELKDGNELLWADIDKMLTDNSDNFMDVLAFDKNLIASNPLVSISDVMRRKIVLGREVFNYTDGLINQFIGQGYVENQTLFTFPYDWRYGVSGKYADGKTNSDLLAQKIQDIMTQTGSDKVDVVAHSQGGLIVKKYVIDHQTNNHIGKAVFVGVPSTGSPKAIKVLLMGDNFDVSFAGFGLSEIEIKKISENMPAGYDLLPSQQYYDTKGSFLEVVKKENFVTTQKDLNYQEFKGYITDDHGLNSQALTNATDLHTLDFDNFDMRTAGVDLYAIDGCNAGTIGKIVEDRQVTPLGDVITNYKMVRFTNGDNTVPIESSSNLPINDNNRFYFLTADHGKMLSQDGGRQEIVNLISGSSLEVKPKFITQDISKCGLTGKMISKHSPINILATDQDGNQSGMLNDGSQVNDIPNADYEAFGNEGFLYLPTGEGQTYQIQMTGTGTGTYTINAQTIIDSQVTGTEVFSNLPVTSELTGQINLGTQTTLTVKPTPTDADQIITASATLDGAQGEDFLPPVSVTTVNGQKDSDGNYTGDVLINIKAMDENSGILNVQYNLDNAGFLKVVGDSASVAVSGEGNHVISFFSTDNAGNNEVLQQISFIIKHPVANTPQPVLPSPTPLPTPTPSNPPVSGGGSGGTGLLLLQNQHQNVDSVPNNNQLPPVILESPLSVPPAQLPPIALKKPLKTLAVIKNPKPEKPLVKNTQPPKSVVANNPPQNKNLNPFLASLSFLGDWIIQLLFHK